MMKKNDDKIAYNLRKHRIGNRYSQANIAQVLSISQASYNRIESGKVKLSLSKAKLLAEFYKVRLHQFVLEDIDEDQI